MRFDRRSFVTGLSAALLLPRGARAATVTDSAGRSVPVPARAERVFPAGPPAAIVLYTLAPTVLLGWTRPNGPEEREFLLPDIGNRPEVGRITGRGNTANLEARAHAQARSHPRRRHRDRHLCLARRPGAGADRHSLCAARRPLRGAPAGAYRMLGELIGRREDAEVLARYAEQTIATIKGRIAAIPKDRRPRIYFARGPRGLETGLGGSITVETIEFLAQNVAGETRGGLGNVSIEQVLVWNPEVIVTIDRDFAAKVYDDPAWATIAAVQARPGASVAQAAVRLGRFPALGQPADRAVVARQDSYPDLFPEDLNAADPRVLREVLSRAGRPTSRSSACWPDGID